MPVEFGVKYELKVCGLLYSHSFKFRDVRWGTSVIVLFFAFKVKYKLKQIFPL